MKKSFLIIIGMQKLSESGWAWVPSLYFTEGLPYFVVNTISVVMFKDLGMDNGTLALLTSLLSLPWVIKPLWSPAVDIVRSKRWWIVAMQSLMAVSVLLVSLSVGNTFLSILFFVILAFASATHDISADGFYMLALDNRRQAAFVGIRNTFYRISMVFGQGVIVVCAGLLEKRCGNCAISWKFTLIGTAVLLGAIALYNSLVFPRPAEDSERKRNGAAAFFRGFGDAFASFFTKKGVWTAICFMLLFRLPEALSIKMLYPLFSDPAQVGGLGLGKEEFGLVYGTFGVIALLAGGILGGVHISRRGLRRCMMPMALSLALPCAVYLYMAAAQPSSVPLIGALVLFDQFGYGYGFTAYTVYMMRFADGPLKTSHYAICTGFMALSMLLPGLVAGYLQQMLGYVGFFILVVICCVVTISVTLLARRRLPSA